MMVEDGVSGYLCPPDNPSSLGKALLKVAGDPTLRNMMGQASRELFEQQFHAQAMAAKVEQVYQSTLTGGGRAYP